VAVFDAQVWLFWIRVFTGWQKTEQGEREVKRALRRSLLKYKLHTDQDLFNRAYGYVVQYY
jgi:type I restriction enzyme R subunit